MSKTFSQGGFDYGVKVQAVTVFSVIGVAIRRNTPSKMLLF